MSNSKKDISDDVAGCLTGIIGGFFSLIVTIFAGLFLYNRNKVRLPNSVESIVQNPVSSPSSVHLWPVLLLGTIFVGGTGVVLYIFANTLPISMCLLSGASIMGALTIIRYSQEHTNAAPAPTATTQVDPSEPLGGIRYTIELPRDTVWHAEPAWRFVEHIVRLIPHCLLQIRAEYQVIRWEILDWRAGIPIDEVVQTIISYYPDAEVTYALEERPVVSEPFYRYTLHFHQVNDFVWPIKTVADIKPYDPLVALSAAIGTLQRGERVTYSLAISRFADYAYKEGEKLITVSRIHPLQFMSAEGTGYALGTALSGRSRDEKYREIDQKHARAKMNSPLYQAFLMVQVDSPVQDRILQLAGVDAHIWQFEQNPFNALAWCQEPLPQSFRHVTDAQTEWSTSILALLYSWIFGTNPTWKRSRLILSTQEIAALWHLPYEAFTAPAIRWLPGRRAPAPLLIAQTERGVYLGSNRYGNQTTPVRLQDADRASHVYIIGKTGVGKSTLLHNIIHQDIAAGKGVGVIDPHGKLVYDLLRSSIPNDRIDDVVLLDVANTAYPPPLNPFAVPPGVVREAALSQILSVLKKIYAEDWSQTRMESAIYSALAALLHDPHATPRDISRIFLDPVYRQQLLRQVTDPMALEYWYDEYENLAPGVQKQTREPVLNRIRIFYRNASVRNMVCHPQQLDFRSIIDGKKIFLANLKSDETRSEKENLGALLLANFQLAALSRGVSTGDAPTRYYLAVDEVQQFVTTSLPETFSEARKFGLSLTVANQYLDQLTGSTLNSILGNAGATIIFSCGPSDAKTLASLTQPEFSANDLVNFDKYHAAAKMQVNSRSMPTFSLNSPQPLPEPLNATARMNYIRERSIQNYTPWTKEEVESWQAERYTYTDRARPTGTVTDYD